MSKKRKRVDNAEELLFSHLPIGDITKLVLTYLHVFSTSISPQPANERNFKIQTLTHASGDTCYDFVTGDGFSVCLCASGLSERASFRCVNSYPLQRNTLTWNSVVINQFIQFELKGLNYSYFIYIILTEDEVMEQFETETDTTDSIKIISVRDYLAKKEYRYPILGFISENVITFRGEDDGVMDELEEEIYRTVFLDTERLFFI